MNAASTIRTLFTLRTSPHYLRGAGDIPWARDEGGSNGSEAAGRHFAERYRAQLAQERRSEEEEGILRTEVVRTFAWAAARQAAIEARVADLRDAASAGEGAGAGTSSSTGTGASEGAGGNGDASTSSSEGTGAEGQAGSGSSSAPSLESAKAGFERSSRAELLLGKIELLERELARLRVFARRAEKLLRH